MSGYFDLISVGNWPKLVNNNRQQTSVKKKLNQIFWLNISVYYTYKLPEIGWRWCLVISSLIFTGSTIVRPVTEMFYLGIPDNLLLHNCVVDQIYFSHKRNFTTWEYRTTCCFTIALSVGFILATSTTLLDATVQSYIPIKIFHGRENTNFVDNTIASSFILFFI